VNAHLGRDPAAVRTAGCAIPVVTAGIHTFDQAESILRDEADLVRMARVAGGPDLPRKWLAGEDFCAATVFALREQEDQHRRGHLHALSESRRGHRAGEHRGGPGKGRATPWTDLTTQPVNE
jgi:hypothetical protein